MNNVEQVFTQFINKVLDAREYAQMLIDIEPEITQQFRSRIAKGIDASNNVMDTHAAKRSGRYQSEYGKKRSKAGLQIGVRDMNFTGQMLASIETERLSNGVRVGFADKLAADKAEYNEMYNSGAIFELTMNENQLAKQLFENKINERLNTLVTS